MLNRKAKFLLMLTVGLVVTGFSAVAFAQGQAGTDVQVAQAEADGWIAIAAGLGIGLAAFGGALGQGRAAATFLDGVARNPGANDKMFTPMIIGLALIESLVIYALVISIMLWLQIG